MTVVERVRAVLGRSVVHRAVVGVVGFSVLLTASFVGLLAFISGASLDVGSRLPFYVLAMSVAFVVGLFLLDDDYRDGLSVLAVVTALSVVTFVLVGLAVEGVVYTSLHPNQVLTSQLLVYFAAAGIICTGVGVWALNHWREFVTPNPRDRM